VRCITEAGTQNSGVQAPLERLASTDIVEPRREPAYSVVSDDAELRRRSSLTGENTSGGDVTSCDVVVDDVTSSTTMRHVSDVLAYAPIAVGDLDRRHQ